MTPEADVVDETDAPIDPLDRVREASDLGPKEKETTLRFAKDEDRARLHTDEAGLTRRFIAHPQATIHTLHVLDGNDTRATLPPGEWSGEWIVGVEASVPVGSLKVRGQARKNDQHAAVVTKRVFDGGERANNAPTATDELEADE